ncbi:sensor histidine kinase, partial [Actinocrinis sp.]|uniref:sensor histidine kinase n=1 Tax=Actinocrinis sp. TaxID=1920516 RepID=UPI002B7D06FD
AQVMAVCEQAAQPLGFTPSVRFTGPVEHLVGADVAEQLVAVLREALSNVARHAGASRVEVDLAADGAWVALTVSDDGVGIAPGGRRSGLTNLRERAQQLGGTFSADPAAAGGTVLAWKVPAVLAPGAEATIGGEERV